MGALTLTRQKVLTLTKLPFQSVNLNEIKVNEIVNLNRIRVNASVPQKMTERGVGNDRAHDIERVRAR